MKRLLGKTALITGGAAGIGKAIAQRFAEEGALVVITDVDSASGKATAAECGIGFLTHDVCDEGRWAEVVQEVEANHGKLDILVNNAGILGPSGAVSPEDTTLDAWRQVFAVNVDGVFLGCRAAIPAMRRSGAGSIINMASVAGLLATPYATAYGASKAAVRQITKSVAQYCAQERLAIRCNSIHPGNVMTPLWEARAREMARARGVTGEMIISEVEAMIPLGEFTHPGDIAAMAAFLASDESRHVTGAKLLVDGGVVNCDTFLMVPKGPTERRAGSQDIAP